MSKKIYVGNLPFQVTEDDVRNLFAPYGEVESVAMITDRETGKFRGFCFVEMGNAEADNAIRALNGTEMQGRALRINEAQPRGEQRRGNGGYRENDRRGGDWRGGDYRDRDQRSRSPRRVK